MKLNNYFDKLKNTPSDINQHLETLKEYGEGCDHITEFGVRHGVSTCALLMAKPKKLISYDIKESSLFPYLFYSKEALDNNIHFEYIIKDVLGVNIEETDLLFIDTLHTYDQLIQELRKHSVKVRKYIIMHDTETFGDIGEKKGTKGLKLAIKLFLNENPNWRLEKEFKHNNGLTIIKRII